MFVLMHDRMRSSRRHAQADDEVEEGKSAVADPESELGCQDEPSWFYPQMTRGNFSELSN